MSATLSENQKNKIPGSFAKPYSSKNPNEPKEHRAPDEPDNWRNHHQGYNSGLSGGSDGYGQSLYGTFHYQSGPNFGTIETNPWSNSAEMGFMTPSGYPPASIRDTTQHYNPSLEIGILGGNGGVGFGSVGTQPGYGYPFHRNGNDYNAWGQSRKPYDDYYRSRDTTYGDNEFGVVDSMSGLSLEKDVKEMMSSGSKKTTWATIASQPAKPQSLLKKKATLSGMPPPPIMLGALEKNGSVPKVPIPVPVQAPNPPAWERIDRVPKMPITTAAPPHTQNISPGETGQSRTGNSNYQPTPNHANMPPPQIPLAQEVPHQQMEQSNLTCNNSVSINSNSSSQTPSVSVGIEKLPGTSTQVTEDSKVKTDYNPPIFDLSAEGARFFVIKSYSEDDIHRSIKYEIWCSTENGNKRLADAWAERDGKGPIYLFFSVNASGHFCGMAQMMSGVDHNTSSSVWCQDKWKGQFKVKWIYVKDVPNPVLKHIRLENNENKPVTNSRDTQEVPLDKGKQVLKIIHTYQHTTSIFDDFIHYEKRQEEEDQRRSQVPSSQLFPERNEREHRNEGRGGGRGGRGGYHSGASGKNEHFFRRDYGVGGHKDSSNYRDLEHHHPHPHSNHGTHGNRGSGIIRGGYERGGFGRSGGYDRESYRERDREDSYRSTNNRARPLRS